MDLEAEVKASYAFVERNFTLVKRYLGWEVVFMTFNVINAITIGLIGVASGDSQQVLYLTIGALLWGFLGILFHEVSESVAWERWEGTIEFTFMAPIRRITMLLGTSLYAIIYGLARTIIVFVILVFFFNLDFSNSNILAAIVVMFVSSLSFIGLGLMAAVLPLISPERGPQATHIIQAIIMLISGIYYPVEVLPAWIKPLSAISPATYTLKMARAALLEGAGLGSMWKDLILLGITGLALIPVGAFIFYLGELYAKRTGKLKRSG
jgi:ABC-2 type transport system permease protein